MASESDKIILFDLPSRHGPAWSLNPWRTRMVLNFKGLDYETKWVEYPEIAPTLKGHVPPNEEEPSYTIPTIKFPDGTYVMNTRTIASAINERHPEPHLELFPPVLQRLLDALTPLQNDILPPVYFYLLPQRVLNEASLEYWYETRTEKAGMPLDRFYREKGGDVAWDAGEKHVREITALLKENPEGPFLQGKTVTYADFYWAGFLIFMRSMGEDVLGELLKRSGDEKVHLDFLKACERWTKRSDH